MPFSTPQKHPASSNGFTLIELMVAITVLGILLGLGVPAFSEIIRNNRTAAQANELLIALSLARSEASKRGLPVAVCAANTAQTGCAGDTTNNWANGWLVFLDDGGTVGAIDVGDNAGNPPVLQTPRRVTNGLQLTTNNLGFVRYGRSGSLTNAAVIPIGTAAITFGLQHQGCSGTNRRQIVIDRTGRPNLTKVACT